MNMKRLLALLACATGLTAWATADYYAVDGSTLTITVPPNVTENFDTSFLATVTGNAVTDIVKDGNGTLMMNQDISAYTGTIHINHGIWGLTDANSLGSLSGGGVYVADGATLENCAAIKVSMMVKKPIFFEGNGFNGIGALYVNASVAQSGNTWGRAMTMTGDAFVNAVHDNYISFYSGSNCYLDMGGHTLYLNGGNRVNAAGRAYVVFYYATLTNPGSIIVTNATPFIVQSVCWWNGSAANRLTFRDSSTFSTGSGGIRGNYLWTLEWDSTGTNLWTCIPNPDTYPDSSNFRNRWRGPVELKKTLCVVVERAVDGAGGIALDGPVSGVGGIDVSGLPARQGFLSLTNAANTFTGGVKVRDVFATIGSDAVPASGGPMEVTDSSLTFSPSFYLLPTGIVTATAAGCTVSNGVGRWAHLVKDGSGTLDYASSIGADTLEIKAGTVRLPAAQTQPWMAGLLEGVGYYTEPDLIKDKTTGEITYPGSQTDGTNDYAYCQRIVTYPANLYNNWVNPVRRTQAWDTESKATRYLITYSGYIWNRTSEPVTWTFAGDVSSWLRLKIDGNTVFDMRDTRIAVRGTVTLTPGPHAFYVVNESKINDGGVQNSATNMTWNKLGVRYDPQGRDSTNGVDYTEFRDPGDGSLFTWCLPDETAEWPVDNAYFDREVVVPDPVAPRGHVSSVPVFRDISATTNACIDFAGGAYAVRDLSGLPTLTSCTGFSVTNRWTVSVAEVVAGGKLVGGPIAFGADTELVVEEDRKTHGEFEAEIASSTAAISGNLSIKDASMCRRFRIRIAGEKVFLQGLPKGLLIKLR